jgi:hypothetical protein
MYICVLARGSREPRYEVDEIRTAGNAEVCKGSSIKEIGPARIYRAAAVCLRLALQN